MAGNGPAPKDPKTRARRNRKPGEQQLVDLNPLPLGTVPKMPKRRVPDGEPAKRWLDETRARWREIWESPMATTYIRTDVHLIEIYIQLYDDYQRTHDLDLLKEMRLREAKLGLTEPDRRRLGMVIESSREADDRPRRPVRQPPVDGKDPRDVFKVHDGGRA